jgi:hypothetical protein
MEWQNLDKFEKDLMLVLKQFFPDLSERIKRIEKEKEKERADDRRTKHKED